MTFDSNRNMNNGTKKGEYELKRFCIKSDIILPGAASKLLKYFIKNYDVNKIISFADIRWTGDKENNLYTNIGFKLNKILSPDYFYYNSKIDKYKRFHKFGFGKKSIQKKFPNIYNPNLTEWQMMQKLGYDRIWDCGKFKYEIII